MTRPAVYLKKLRASLYPGMLHLPHPVSQKHPHMSRLDRAAQFSPFAALSGYEAALQEAGRLTEERIELAEGEKEEIRCRLQAVQDAVARHPEITVVYFVPDEKKEGGSYVTAVGRVKRLDEFSRTLLFQDGRSVPLDEIVDLRGDCLRDAK